MTHKIVMAIFIFSCKRSIKALNNINSLLKDLYYFGRINNAELFANTKIIDSAISAIKAIENKLKGSEKQ